MPPRIEPADEEEIVECSYCADDVERGGSYEVEGATICSNCYDEETTTCNRCLERVNNDHINHIELTEDYLCRECFDRAVNSGEIMDCHNCGDNYPSSEVVPLDDMRLCSRCFDRMQQREQRSAQAPLPPQPTQKKAENPGKIVTSPRRYGIELETVFKSEEGELNMERGFRNWSFQGDGSIRTGRKSIGGVEIVSPILQEKDGEDQIKLITKEAKENGFNVNKSCGFHLHLEAPEFKRVTAEDKNEPHPKLSKHEIVYVWKVEGSSFTNSSSRFEDIPVMRQPDGSLKQVKYVVKTQETNNMLTVNKGQAFYLLRDLWYVYLAFDDIFRGMQPPSRRNNRFCKSTSSLYSLDAIRELQDYGDLERLWYKADKRKRLDNQTEDLMYRKNRKDGSRYVGFNLEPILRNGGKTIEIRYHAPTLNAEKILRWIDIHQTIFDRISVGNWDENAVELLMAEETHLIRKAKKMCELFGIKKETEEYMIERLTKFNKINATEAEMEDEEIEESEIGRPSHGDNPVPRLVRPVPLEQNQARPQRTGSRAYSIDMPTLTTDAEARRIEQIIMGQDNSFN